MVSVGGLRVVVTCYYCKAVVKRSRRNGIYYYWEHSIPETEETCPASGFPVCPAVLHGR